MRCWKKRRSQRPLLAAESRALVFDVDGTLYRQRLVRSVMLWRLLRAHVLAPGQGLRLLRILQAYRRAQEHMRQSDAIHRDIAYEQCRLAGMWSGVSPEEVASYVSHWMMREPLDIVARAVRPGLVSCLTTARACGFRLARIFHTFFEEKAGAMA
jgi:FMN phosphatase YigB (HAD superfamily)